MVTRVFDRNGQSFLNAVKPGRQSADINGIAPDRPPGFLEAVAPGSLKKEHPARGNAPTRLKGKK